MVSVLTFIRCACLYQKFNLGSLNVTEKKSNFIFTSLLFSFSFALVTSSVCVV